MDGVVVMCKSYYFSDIASNCAERITPSSGDEKYYVGLEHMSSDSLYISDWGSKTELVGEKIKMKKGDVLFARRNAYLKRVGIAPIDGIFSAHGLILRPNESVISNELFPFLIKSNIFMNRAINISVGSLSPTVNWKDLVKESFFIPDLILHEKYSKILWSFERLIVLYATQIKILDKLVKSQFIEMFGDCTSRSKLGDVCSLHARIGWQGLTKNEHAETGNHLLVTGTDFKEGLVNYPGCKFVSKDRYDQDSKIMIQNGDVLVTKDGSIGKVAIVKNLPSPATLNAGIFVVRTNSKLVLGEYMQYCFMSNEFSNFIESMKRGATIAHLNQEKFIKYQIPLPTILLQKEFISFVNQVDKSKFFCRNCIIMTKYIKRQSTILYRGK